MRGMLLAAGLGTRLRPLTDERPKPVVPVGNRPLAAGAMRTFARAGVHRIDANAHHLAELVQPALAPFAPASIAFEVHREAELLGTGGGIRNAVRLGAREDVLVVNGDIVFEPDVAALIDRHRATDAVATLVVRSHPDPFALGAVEVDEDGFVIRIAGAPTDGRTASSAYVFTGAHLLAPAALDALPESGCVVRRTYQPLLARGARIAVVVDESPWADLGTIPHYAAANLDRAALSEDPRGLVDEAAIVRGPVRASVIGAHAEVGPNARLDACIVWDGAKVDEPLTRAIVTRRGIVRIPP